MECTFATSLWNALNFNIVDVCYNFGSIQDWIISWFYTYDSSSTSHTTDSYVIKLMCIVWYIWKDRCSMIFQGVFPNLHNTITRINNLISQCNFVNAPTRNASNRNILPKVWFPPEAGFIKVNIDASYIYETRRGSIGKIVRNCAGQTLAVQGFNLEEELEAEVSAEHFECKALMKAVEWIEENGFNKVIIETDCENLVNSIHSNEPQVHWFNHHLILSVKKKFLDNEFWFYKLVNRLSNGVAHELAKKARLDANSFFYDSIYLPDIVKWIEDDYVLLKRI
ncbi:uncharacterized protein LOC113316207 [Papaver somniferum]|uniref:uncharacterized protein LOC113316207 n=1 Tax=Papaver somniferum TaxID=3469 RepID=UPI000E6F915E|nr:uncharacterized protein LOC113316207 [Papaver somniferum]